MDDKKVLVRFPAKTYRLLESLAEEQGVDVTRMCYGAILEYLLDNLEPMSLPVELKRRLQSLADEECIDVVDMSHAAIIEYIDARTSPFRSKQR